MSDSKEEGPASLSQVNEIASSLFGGGEKENNNDEKNTNDEKKEENSGEAENNEKSSNDDNASKSEADKSNSDKENTEKSDAAHESEDNQATPENAEKDSDAQDKSNLEEQVNKISGALFDKKEDDENAKSENKEETDGSHDKSETEGEKEKSEAESEKDKSETDAEKTDGETDGNKEEADSTALSNTLGELTGTLTGENENENKNESENENETANDDSNGEEQSTPVHEPSEKKSSTPRRNISRYNDTQPVSTKNYSDEELQKAVDDLLKNNKAPEDDMVPALRKYIESEMTEAALNQKYEYGLQLEKATNILNEVTAVDTVAIKSEKKRQQAEERHATAKQEYDNSVKEWEDRISQYRQEQEKRISDLEQEHKRQMTEFEEQWSKPENLLEYNKPSPQLIRLRTTEQNLALQKNFERAKEVKSQADHLLKEEQAEAQRRAVVDMRLAYEALDMRQKREMECLLQHTQSTIDSMERERDKCIVPMSQVVKRHKENSRPKTTRSGARGLSETSRSSPRPIRTKITATTIKPAIGLGITGIDVKQFIKPKKPQSLSTTQPNSPRK